VHPVKINSARCAACNRLEVAISKLSSVYEPSIEVCGTRARARARVFVRACSPMCACARARVYIYIYIEREREREGGEKHRIWSEGRTLTYLDFKGEESFQCTSYKALMAVGEIPCIFNCISFNIYLIES
jgi:hypothetical protein